MSRRNSRWLLIAGILVCLVSPSVSQGQGTGSVISGLVRDSSQAVISGATVTALNMETGITRTTESDAQGRYRVGELQPGTYQITVAISGFNKQTQKDILLTVGQEVALNFTLQVGAVEQAVTVTSSAPVVETTSASVTAAVTQEQLRELPLNGRSFVDLVGLQAGTSVPSTAAQTANYGNGPQLSVSGARSDSNSFMVDGTDMNNSSNGTPGSAAGVQLGVDTIREYQVITSNAKAEYGRSGGGIINAVSRSGTNDWHGSLFEFLRNNALDARRFVDPKGLPPFKRNQFGATFGGPIRKDQTFFFLGYEGLRQRLTQTFPRNVPTAAARTGNLGLASGPVPVNASVVPYLGLYSLPDPNTAVLGGGIGVYNESVPQPTNEGYGSIRVDHNFSAKDFLFGRYTIDRADNVQAQNYLSTQVFNSGNQYFTVQEDHIFSATMLNTARIGFNRSVNLLAATEVPGGEKLGYVPNRGVGTLTVTGLSILGPGTTTDLIQYQNAYQYEDDLTYTKGAHTMKFGAMFEHFQWNTDQPAFIRGSITFRSLADFLQAGSAGGTGAQVLLPQSSTYRWLRSNLFAFFAQDDFKVTPRLMLNYGLRWEFTTGLSENNGKLAWMRNGPLVSTYNDLVTGAAWQNHIAIFDPRLGFNWSLDEKSNTVLSGGFGIFHNQILNNSQTSFRAQLPFYFRGNFTNIPNTAGLFPNIVAMIQSTANGVDISTLSAFRVTRHFDYYNFKTPAINRFNLALQRQLPGGIALRVGYVGAISRHLARRQLLNFFPNPIVRSDGSLFFPSAPAPQFINPNFSQIEWMSSDVNAGYNALVVNLQKRFSRGLTFQASYTYSKSLDDQSASESNYSANQVNGEFSPDRTLDRGLSSFNVPRSFVGNWIYELPVGPGKSWLNSGGVSGAILGGWQVGGIVTIQSGVPFTVTSGASATGYSFTANRPNLILGTDLSKLTKGSFGNTQHYFDPSGFSVPPPGTIGNAARNLLLGPGISTVNFTLSKIFSLGERMRLQFRSEFFNFLNHTNFANPNGATFTSQSGTLNPAYGQISNSSTNARQIQFGLKLTF